MFKCFGDRVQVIGLHRAGLALPFVHVRRKRPERLDQDDSSRGRWGHGENAVTEKGGV